MVWLQWCGVNVGAALGGRMELVVAVELGGPSVVVVEFHGQGLGGEMDDRK